MEKYKLSFREENYKYLELFTHIKKLIELGKLEDGEKLPSIRKLANFLDVNTVTIINAYKKLESDGLAVLKIGSGTYIKKKEVNRNIKKEYSETFKKISSGQVKNIIDFAGEYASSNIFPVKTFQEVLNEVLDRDGAEALIYQDSLGYFGLRESICEYFWNRKTDYNDILILSGAQQGIDIISKVLINFNDNILVEKPTYGGALSVFNWRRANIYEAEMLNDGINLSKFEHIVKKQKIKCFYTMSYFQNPTGSSYSMEKKLRILELAEKYDFYIIEDDYLSELIYDKNISYASFKSLDVKDRVIYIKSFSKIFLPGIRIGYMICPPFFRDAFQNAKINSDISTSSLMQRALDLYLRKGFWIDHISCLNYEYKNRYNVMVNLLDTKLKDKVSYLKPGGGLNLFLNISDTINKSSSELFYESREMGVIIAPGGMFYKRFDDGDKSFRIGFSQTNEEEITRGIDLLGKLL
jgi:Transcriptional regulators containing a DNA-binding HTH domain and an aminotransferase domain (MocR family) and their eukaryotic orthologs